MLLKDCTVVSSKPSAGSKLTASAMDWATTRVLAGVAADRATPVARAVATAKWDSLVFMRRS